MSIQNDALERWIAGIVEHVTPGALHLCDGSDKERLTLERQLVRDGTLLALDQQRYPRSYLYRSHASDVDDGIEHLTFVCSENRDDAGPTNNWMSPEEARRTVWPLFRRAMRGRTLYVVPYLLGPPESRYSRVGIELTDSPYVVLSLRLMTRMGKPALDALGSSGNFVRGVHSLGDLNPGRRFIVHFPESRTILSIGSGFGSNALLSRDCHALRIASIQGRAEGWLAEHMLLVGITGPDGETHYVGAAFPDGCGKTDLAMLVPTLPGYRVETLGDDICWMHVGDDGRLWAISPEAGIFGAAPGTSQRTNPNLMRALEHDALFTNVALRADGTPWWEGLEEDPGLGLCDWRGRPVVAGSSEPAAHPNSRVAVSLEQLPSVSSRVDDPRGVPISAIIFGSRRSRVAPLVYEAFDWEHGVYVGATMGSETAAPAARPVGSLRNEPMAMRLFCGYNMADYFGHWLAIGQRLRSPPRIFHVNWFRRDRHGALLWPGLGENIRVFDWMLRRVRGTLPAWGSALGWMPVEADLQMARLYLQPARMSELLRIDFGTWDEELEHNREFLKRFGDRLPRALWSQHERLGRRLSRDRVAFAD